MTQWLSAVAPAAGHMNLLTLQHKASLDKVRVELGQLQRARMHTRQELEDSRGGIYL